jgi:predicted RNA-binding Zn-ribbon protein involved in translation (DUF1610 family)
MTLDEAIKQCEEAAEDRDKLCKRCDAASGYSRSHNESIRTQEAKEYEKCSQDFRQLAAWLLDLKQFKEKEKAKAVHYESDTVAHCPRCNWTFELLYESWENEFHCPNCGQRLRWRE